MSISAYSDNDIMMLEQLTYLNDDLLDAAGIRNTLNLENMKGKTIAEILEVFDDNALAELRTSTVLFN